MRKKETVFVGLSGGVDSSVSAALLKSAGYDVVGVFIRVWQPDFLPCTQDEDLLSAMRVAAHLDIPFVELDLEDVYKKEVVDYMVREYTVGRTPNPDVMCNKTVKFGAFFEYAMKEGADFVATGHYARIKKDRDGAKLLKAKDAAKDQSYFLWTLTQRELSKTLFPIGGYKKDHVRTLARTFGLHTAGKKDSQGLCFVGQLDMKEFLSHFVPTKKGAVLDLAGKVIGEHDGAHLYTLGERHGFIITAKHPHDAPLYVVEKDIAHNTITVSPKEMQDASGITNISLDQSNWIGRVSEKEKTYAGAVRYHGKEYPLTIKDSEARPLISFAQPVIVSEGQSLVVYDGDVCIGGGVVEAAR